MTKIRQTIEIVCVLNFFITYKSFIFNSFTFKNQNSQIQSTLKSAVYIAASRLNSYNTCLL